jgi:hypothetical protein
VLRRCWPRGHSAIAVRQSAANEAACYFSGMKKPKKQKAKKRQPPQKKADVAASLAPSPTPPSFRGSFLLWFSAVAAAFTLFSGLQVVLDIADWARWLVEHWRGWTFGFWKRIGDYFGLQTYPQTAALLTFMSCIIPIAFAAMRLEAGPPRREKTIWAYVKSHEFVFRVAEAMGAAFGAIFLYCLAVEYFVAGKMFALAMPAYIFALASSGVLFVIWIIATARYQGACDAGHYALLAVFIAAFYFILTLQTTLGREYANKEQAELERYLLLHVSAIWIPIHIHGFFELGSPAVL